MVTGVGTANTQVEAQRAAANEARRSNKPIMEKRRRARINNCLNELKTLILDAMKKDPARHSKLEKADILEMTVRHLEALQRQRAAADPAVLNKFRAGFTECAGEVGRFPGLDPAVRRRLLQHLASCLTTSHNANQTQVPAQQSSTNIFLTTGAGLQLVPTRLPNGDIALVLPAQPPSSSPMPTLIPIPARTASAASASSTASSASSSSSSSSSASSTTSELPPASPDTPLALVTRRKSCDQAHEDEKPWRPW